MTRTLDPVTRPLSARRNLGMVALLALIVLLGAGVVYLSVRPARQLKGTDLEGTPAPGFQLTDSNGRSVALEDYRGKVVVLTFLYTHCPDECPLIAEHLRAAAEQMPDSMKQVAFVAVSVDPANDTPDAVNAFLKAHRVSGYLTYLVGTESQLRPVWSSYYIYAQQDAANLNVVGHSSRVVIIDRAGKQRVNLDPDFAPGDLVYDVQTLLTE